jgi:hypothetical protein
MNNLDFAKEIDRRRASIALRYNKDLKNVFSNLTNDAYNIFLATGNIPSLELAINYNPEFISIIRQIMRDTLNEFGYDLRNNNSNKVIKSFYVKADKLDILLSDDELREVNREFEREMLLFVANESERQALYIQNTNFNALESAKQKAILENAKKIQNLQKMITDIYSKISRLSIREIISGVKNDEIKKLEERRGKLQRFLIELRQNQRENLANSIKNNLEEKEDARVDIIAFQISKITEGEARNNELIKLGILLESERNILLFKDWIGILDSKIRPSHSIANGQRVRYDENFIVGGYECNGPGDSSLPINETAYCRCTIRVTS